MAGLPLLLRPVAPEPLGSAFQQLPTSRRPFSHPPAVESSSGSRPGPPAPGGDGGSRSPPRPGGKTEGGDGRAAEPSAAGRVRGGGSAHAPRFPSLQPNAVLGEKKAHSVAEGKKRIKRFFGAAPIPRAPTAATGDERSADGGRLPPGTSARSPPVTPRRCHCPGPATGPLRAPPLPSSVAAGVGGRVPAWRRRPAPGWRRADARLGAPRPPRHAAPRRSCRRPPPAPAPAPAALRREHRPAPPRRHGNRPRLPQGNTASCAAGQPASTPGGRTAGNAGAVGARRGRGLHGGEGGLPVAGPEMKKRDEVRKTPFRLQTEIPEGKQKVPTCYQASTGYSQQLPAAEGTCRGI